MGSAGEAPLLVVRGASVRVRGRTVLRRVRVEARRGRVYLVVGPNGSGKTSLLSALAGRRGYELEGGEALYEGRPLAGAGLVERARRGLVLAYQSPPPLRGVVLRSLAREVARVYGCPLDAGGLAGLLGVEALMDRPLAGLSGGERRRVELYLAALQRPRLLLLDEPDSGVDVDWLERLVDAVELLARRGAAVLLASHTAGFMERLAGRGLVERVYLVHRGEAAPLPHEPLEALRALRRGGFAALHAGGGAG